ncbi:MAG TPA: VOC family protein [Bacteroidota bacterium]|nr:VOC family protein [Bacteroidota bacterium]
MAKSKKSKGHFGGLRTAVYYVSDVKKARSWYVKVLGVKPYFNMPQYYVGFNVGGFELGLHPDSKKRAGKSGGVDVYWGVTSASASYNRLIKLGAKQFTAVQDVGEGIKLGVVKDPFGNLFGVIENPHFKIAS